MRYLLLSFFRKKGGQIDEMVSVSKQLKESDYKTANIIMDFALKKVEKSIIEGKEHDTTFDRLREYYLRIYPQLIEQLDREAPFYISTKIKNKK